jgi:hypothetical protein
MYHKPPTAMLACQSKYAPIFSLFRALRNGQLLLDIRDSKSWIQALGARTRAVQDGVTTVHAHAVIEGVQALSRLLVPRISEPAIGLQENGRAEIFLGIPPV